MSVRMSADEAWTMIEEAHTGIFTSLRRDGMPIALPVWFAALDRTICLVAPSKTKKIARLRHDPRASFLVESGERWAELRAVHLTGSVVFVEDETEITAIDEAIQAKYQRFQTPHQAMPERTQQHYAGRTFLRLVPDERILSWENARLQLKG